MIRPIAVLLTWCLLACTPKSNTSAGPEVLVSIRPLALMVEELAGSNSVTVHMLLPASADPHNFALRVSDMQKLSDADLVIWLGPDLERSLGKAMEQVTAERELELTEVAGLVWPDADHHDAHPEHARDPHVWLSPRNSALLMRAIADRLVQLVPEERAAIEGRLKKVESDLKAFTTQTEQQLAPVKERGFAVHHDGFRHFVQAFGLRQLAAVSELPEERLSARHLSQLQQSLADAHCLMAEQVTPEVERLASTLDLPLVAADPLASSADITGYVVFLQLVRKAFSECLGAEPAPIG